MNLVIDASVIVKWYVDEIDTEVADRLMLDSRFVFCVPAHTFSEVGNALATNIRRGLLSRSRLPEVSDLLSTSVRTYPIERFLPAAVEIALDIGLNCVRCVLYRSRSRSGHCSRHSGPAPR